MRRARIPLLGPEANDARVREVLAGFAAEGRDPISLHRALGHAPPLLEAFAAVGRTIRYEGRTERTLRELVILRVAQLTGSRYVWAHHRKMALELELPPEKLSALDSWRESERFDARERAALRATEEIAATSLSDAAFADLEREFDLAELCEVVMTAAHYQSVARVVDALGVEIEPEYQPWEEDR